ncbi:hypothetical protein [Streptomyces sp. NPDC053427]|uniref:hypothetical protein n=1 Tax=Streptomyces sp. NPDC053427 TaxID=3365701 RepID=UPI0037D1D0D3
MARDAEPDLRELITVRSAELEVQAQKLSQRFQEVRDDLEGLTETAVLLCAQQG